MRQSVAHVDSLDFGGGIFELKNAPAPTAASFITRIVPGIQSSGSDISNGL
jgi:hypothetical protein